MATQLFLTDSAADTHRGTNTARRDGTANGWAPRALSLTNGSTPTASLATATVTGATNGVEIRLGSSTTPAEWISPPVSADVTISGTITANIWAMESNMSANVAINVIIDIIRSDLAGTIVNIVQSTRVTEVAISPSIGVNNFTTGMTSGGYTGQTLNRGDRLRVRVVGDDVGTMATGFTFEIAYNGSAAGLSESYVTFTENITFESATPGVLSQPSHGNFLGVGISAAQERVAQSFLAPSNVLTEVRAWLSRTGTLTDDLVIEIQTDSAGVPSGTVVGTVATVVGSTLTGTNTEFTYSVSITTTPGTKYWLVFRRSGGVDGSNVALLGSSVSVAATPIPGWAAAFFYNGSAWAISTAPNDRVLGLTLTGGTSTVYLTDTASAVSTASVDREAWTSRGAGVQTDVRNTAAGWTAPLQLTDTAGGTVVDWFTRPLTAFTLTGMAVANLRALESNTTANASLSCEIARVEGDGTSPTVWAAWCIAPTGTDNGELTTSEVARTANVSGDDLAISDGQRLRIRVYADDYASIAMAASQTVTFYYAGTSGGASGDTYITFPQTLTEYASGPFTYTKAGYGKEAG